MPSPACDWAGLHPAGNEIRTPLLQMTYTARHEVRIRSLVGQEELFEERPLGGYEIACLPDPGGGFTADTEEDWIRSMGDADHHAVEGVHGVPGMREGGLL
jgi:hypothetical protein